MELEDAIASDQYLDVHRVSLVNLLPPLTIVEISSFISGGNPRDDHKNMAVDIINRRVTARGWRNYLYCITNIIADVDVVIANYCQSVVGTTLDNVELFVSLMYSAVLVLIPGTKLPAWKYFRKGIWMNVDQQQVMSMIRNRLVTRNISRILGIDTDGVGKLMNKLSTNLIKGFSGTSLFMSTFRETCDKRDSVFVMPNTCYDINRGILRIGLPDDFATLAGEVDPDLTSWSENRGAMLEVFRQWMSDMTVVDTYLDAIGSALSEFKPRYAMINSGTGSDGKSTFCHIIKNIFGGYCSILPSKGLMIDTNNANDATPIANSMVNKRLCIVPDAIDIVKVIESPGFKSISGGDEIYRRGLHQEAVEHTTQVKLLPIVNTNQSTTTITGIASLTRIKITMWLSKRINEDDRYIIPSHQILGSSEGTFKYEVEFLRLYGGCLMMELIMRNKAVKERGYRINVCELIRQWTREMVSPRTVIFFLSACTEKVTTNNEASTQIVSYLPTYTSINVTTLFTAYISWRKTAGRFSNTDPVNLQSFTCHLEFYHPILTRKSPEGFDEAYIEGIKFKPEYETLGMMYSQSNTPMNFISGVMMAPITGMNPRNSVITYPN